MTPDRVTEFEADIAASPASLGRLLDGWRAVDLAGRTRICFTGLGSSRFAALVVAEALRSRGALAWVEHATAEDATRPADDLVLFAISASGRTSEVRAAADRHRGRTLVVAVTNDPSAPLAGEADHVVALQAGVEVSGIACRTYRATVAALALITGLASTDGLRPAVDGLAARVADAADRAEAIAELLDGAAAIDVLAGAPLIGLAEQAALMLREAPRLPAHAWDTGDWLHTGVYLALPGHRALLYAGTAADDEAIATIERRGGRVALVGGRAADRTADPIARTIVESVEAELIAARLWRRADAPDGPPP